MRHTASVGADLAEQYRAALYAVLDSVVTDTWLMDRLVVVQQSMNGHGFLYKPAAVLGESNSGSFYFVDTGKTILVQGEPGDEQTPPTVLPVTLSLNKGVVDGIVVLLEDDTAMELEQTVRVPEGFALFSWQAHFRTRRRYSAIKATSFQRALLDFQRIITFSPEPRYSDVRVLTPFIGQWQQVEETD